MSMHLVRNEKERKEVLGKSRELYRRLLGLLSPEGGYSSVLGERVASLNFDDIRSAIESLEECKGRMRMLLDELGELSRLV